ncbi:DUF202 domain-containing protein [Aeromicrobium halocynthiae]|uniref:DUF202 domain-containing protein n=1 Tax=Aeromicrobium halocynthiae TaxID=560557 RepID=UPI0031DC108C
MSTPSPLAPERTTLAWRRTVATLVVLGLLLVRVALLQGAPVAVVAGVVAVVVALAAVVTPAPAAGRPADGRRPAGVGAGVGVLALAVVALALER